MTDKTIIADEVVSRSIATVQDAVAGFDTFQAGIAAIDAAHPRNLACDVATTAGMKQAIAGRAAWRDPRIALDKARKAAKAPVLELGRAIDAFAGRIETELRIGESNYDDQIEAHKKAVQDAAIARAKAEAERIARHEAGLNTIRLYVQKANGLESAKLRLGIEALAAQRYGAEWEEFAAKAVIAQTETLETLESMLNIAVAREEEAAERERQRAENARVAAELAAENAALAAQKAKDEAAAAELRKAEDAKRAAELAAQRAEQARIAAEQRAAQDALDAQAAELQRQADAIAAHNAAVAEAERVKREAEEAARLAAEDAARIAEAAETQAALDKMLEQSPLILGAPPGALEKEEEPSLPLESDGGISIYKVMRPFFMLMLTKRVASALVTLSENHYDSRCQLAGREGGFLYGWRNHFVEFELDSPVETSPRDLDTLMKIMELPAELLLPDDFETLDKLSSLKGLIRHAMRKAGCWT